VATRQGVGDAIDELFIIEQRIDPAERGRAIRAASAGFPLDLFVAFAT